MKKITTSFFMLAAMMFAGCEDTATTAQHSDTTETQQQSQKITVSASFYPLAEFTRNIGKDKVDVLTVTPPGAEPHEYEPTPKDMTNVRQSKIFLLNGGGQDAWGEKIQDDLREDGIEVVNMADQIQLAKSEGPGEHNDLDPHIWLDPVLAQREVEIIRDALIKVDPANKDFYSESAQTYIQKLMSLDEEFKQGLSSCKLKDFITSHKAFGYLAKRYGLNQIPISGISTEEEPSARKLGDISTLAKEKNIKYIFFETLVSPKLSETIAKEIGAQTMVLDPIEGVAASDVAAGKNYVTLMQDNLKNLRIALECE